MPESPVRRPRQLPPYRAVAVELGQEIEEGLYDSKPFPGEIELSARFGMARMTIRRALDVLRERGLITTRWGKGSTVVPPEERPAPTPDTE
ncbi:GntR family transcriptional regulator [Streptomyces sp. NRRL S-350]|uniref:GntR family transcriptional regulator n=1 Tax=Streptomyces sp. NRRL S-350 TaxID=1463902 RepID=UPI00099BF063|nr:GntR family transcriptional regulator [Streptomyces sp. NRRL S-350]